MTTSKKTMLAAALAVAVIALAGVGYAAVTTSYKATTINDNNSLDSTYITLDQTGQGIYNDNFFTKLYFDSANAKNNTTGTVSTTYTPVCDYAVNDTWTALTKTTTNASLALVSKTLGLQITPKNNESTTINLQMTVADNSAFSPVAGLTYWLAVVTPGNDGAFTVTDKISVTSTTYDAATGWKIDGLTISATAVTTLNVVMLIEGNATGDLDGGAGFGHGTGESATKTVFKFTATVPTS